MRITVIEHLERSGQRALVDAELAELGIARKTLNDPVNRQHVITALEARFPKWRQDVVDDTAK